VKGRSPGKVPIKFLKQFVFGRLGAPRKDVVQGPGVGRDFAAVKEGDVWIVCSSDPVTGAQSLLGRIAVNVATNDVSMSGIRPRWLSVTALIPLRCGLRECDRLFRDIHRQARRLGVSIVGGHTEYVSYLTRPIAVVTAVGASRRKPRLPSDARAGDLILSVGDIAIEGTAILATEKGNELLRKGVPASIVAKAKRLVLKTSTMDSALYLARFKSIKSMHDPTEGGIVGGLYEMSVASGLGFRADLDLMSIKRETAAVVKALRLDPYRLISSGSILASCSPEGVDIVLSRARSAGTNVRAIGRFTDRANERVIVRSGKRENVTDVPSDELWRAIG